MRDRTSNAHFLACLALFAAQACSSPSGTQDAGPPTPEVDAGLCADTWQAWGESFFAANCMGCHAHNHSAFSDVEAVRAQSALITQRVTANLMPQGAVLSPEDKARLLDFIACGAPSAAGDAATTFEPVSAATAVAKVKMILVGLPPTDAEISAVAADPNAMPGLIDGWMALPQFADKMQTFFELAFQQTQITPANLADFIPPNGIPGGSSALLVQNMRESFARTALELARQGKPFSEVFTTHQLMMTPALMQVYAWLDVRQVDDSANTSDLWLRANPGRRITLQRDAGVVPMADSANPASPNYLKFYNPTIGTGILGPRFNDARCNTDPIVIGANSDNLLFVVYGQVPAHNLALGDGGTVRCNVIGSGTDLFAATDFTDWRLVTIRKPVGTEQPTRFLDLAALRTADTLVLNTARTGFFSTLAFFANWPTNQSNQMRVTMNQALIVATGTAIDGLDRTPTPTTPGLDAFHAAEAACYSCHRVLDPARSIFSATWTSFYSPQADATQIAQKGTFAFQGLSTPVSSLDDFGATLARHPLMPSAWVQKLCNYANSAPCVDADPEFKRVVAAFETTRSWNELVKTLFSSPLITNLSPSITRSAHGEVIAVTRRDHLCAALDARLGITDVCGLTLVRNARVGVGVVPSIVGGLPSDGYGRGATEPILPNEPTLFYRAGLENVCAAVAAILIDATGAAGQPTARRWSSATPEPAFDDFTSRLLNLAPADPRWAPARALLAAHFEEAKKTASATDALRSTFVTACLSPTLIGIGL